MAFFYRKPEVFKDKRVLVMGLGLHGGGLGAAKWLVKHGARVTITDLKSAPDLAPSVKELEKARRLYIKKFGPSRIKKIKYVLGSHRREDFENNELIIWNPGVPRESEFLAAARTKGVKVLTDVGIFFELCPRPTIGITGTKGKSTTTTLIGLIMKKVNPRAIIAGNIRVSVMDALDKLLSSRSRLTKNQAPAVVLELSSWQLEGLALVKKSPHIAVLTNIFEDHLNRYADLVDYAQAKRLIFDFQKAADAAVVNYDNELAREAGRQARVRLYWFSKSELPEGNGAFRRGRDIFFRDGGTEKKILSVADVKLKGVHNLENVLAAVAAASLAGAPPAAIRTAIKEFRGLPGRLELVRRWRDLTFINDTTATAPEATIAALRTLTGESKRQPKTIVLIAGGQDKNLQFEKMTEAIERHVKAAVFFVGSATEKIEKHLAGRLPSVKVKSMSEAVAQAVAYAAPGDTVLLSPGAASFGRFKHEFDRGEKFVREVERLPQKR